MEPLNKRILTFFVLVAMLPFLTGATIIIRGPRVATAAASTLDDFSNLEAWYKTPITGATNGVAIPGWEDSKNSYDLTSADDPIYATNVINGYDAVDFDAKFLTGGGYTASTYPYTFVIVGYYLDTSAYRMLFGASDSGGINFRVDQSTGYINSDKSNVANIGTGNVAASTGAWHVFVGVLTSTTWALWIDGVPAGNGSNTQTLTAGRTLQLGGDSAGANYIWGDYIVEAGIYSVDHTANVAAITSAMQTKYGL